MCADISSFFDNISKPNVTNIVDKTVQDSEFLDLFVKAITIELSNMAQLRDVEKFPIHEIGVAQGNALSPLLGNIVLHDFDREMNAGDCQCFRYIDDFIILAPSGRAARSRFRKAERLLGDLKMNLSPEKSSKAAIQVLEPFTFLGIEFSNGFIRPSKDSRERILTKIRDILERSQRGFNKLKAGDPLDEALSFLATIKRADGIIEGWGKHYKFCNDFDLMKKLDDKVTDMIGEYIGHYADTRTRVDERKRRDLFGVQQLKNIEMDPLTWPRVS